MSRFFIDRPIFAWVIAIVIMLAGLLSIETLPIEQYPDIAPPSVSVKASYPGASAQAVQESVTQVIEQQMKGIDNLVYMSSTSSSQGTASITLTFEAGTDPDIAQVQTQNKLQQVMSQLPQEVQSQGVTVTKSTSGFLMVVGFYSADRSLSATDIGDYVSSKLLDPISRVNGVGSVNVLGSQYAMRIWLDPEKLRSYGLMPSDVRSAVEAQNAQVSSGELGGLPALAGQRLNATITAQSKLRTIDEFRDIVLRVLTDGSAVKLGDVARVELGAESYSVNARANGAQAAGMGIALASGANAVDVAEALQAKLQELSPFFPQGLKYQLNFDSSEFVKISIEEVVKALFEAIALVFVIMYLFLQSVRATFIAIIVVPVVLLGTFGVLAISGFSINTLTMFGMVLAIGLLVDDAIVVVENVERLMQEERLSPRDATRKSMDQITGALLGIALVLAAVFVPMAFFGGSTGMIYRQFSITLVSAMALSVVVAITLTPALCASLLKPYDPQQHAGQHGFFGWFNRTFERGSHQYTSAAGRFISHTSRSLVIYAALIVGAAWLFWRMPTAFLPEEDQGAVMAITQLAPGATQEQTLAALKRLEDYALSQKEDVQSIFSAAGFSFGGNGQSSGMSFLRLKNWSERKGQAHSAAVIASKATQAMSGIRDASIFVMSPPAIRGLGTTSGFDLQLQDVGGVGYEALTKARDQLIALAAKEPALRNVRVNGLSDQPQLSVQIDHRRAGALGLSASDINDTLSSAWGGSYINDFVHEGRVKQVYMQGDAPYRMLPNDLSRWYVRNSSSEMVPVSSFATEQWTTGSPQLSRYDGLSSLEIVGDAAPGASTGTAMAAIERLMAQLPRGIDHEWTGMSYQERLSGAQAPMLYAISLVFVFLCLAALYESWSIPFSVMLAVPIGVVGALLAASLRGLSNDVYFQVGLLTTAGLASKNAILIVEFAKDLHAAGQSLMDATLNAARVRLRPILMTSLAFIFGVLPLALSSGAGSGARIAIGMAVMGGMITATGLGIFFVPAFFVMVRRWFARKTPALAATPEHA